MVTDSVDRPARGIAVVWRVAWTIGSLVAMQTAVCGVSAGAAIGFWWLLLRVGSREGFIHWAVISLAIAPSYIVFALSMMVVSPVALRIAGWRTPADVEMRIADLGWPLLDWVRYGASLHLVRVVAGTIFRGTPLWTAHLRLAGARLGRRVFVNSLSLSDYNLIACGDDVVIGDGVHLSGHTVENGIVKTAGVRLGSHVTIGLESVIDIDVEIGSHVQIGALSFVPKHTRLPDGGSYAGIPAVPLHRAQRS